MVYIKTHFLLYVVVLVKCPNAAWYLGPTMVGVTTL
jgi:hypothetical protein